ncbi:Multicopper oxidase/laccase [Mycena sanguinolenta]|uniref:laccase n=1 Tax=Mycena sanguinolenta TaxID=230812 RepID=A0A8H7D339_9AGAR|nr:Multicopper oxidase/laccase [Mycena sanguinolenta]
MTLSSFLVLSMLSGVLSDTLPPITNLPIANKVLAPDGYSRNTALAGGTFPGPLIANTKDLPFAINVENQLTDPTMYLSTSIHWHGLFQKNTSWADGVSFVTQCPIVPDHSFLYQFSAPGQAGTFWYHSHLSTQYCDGVRGPLVIYDPEDPHKHLYDIDDASTVITLADWYHYASKTAPPPNLPVSNSTLINGLGRYTAITGFAPIQMRQIQLIKDSMAESTPLFFATTVHQTLNRRRRTPPRSIPSLKLCCDHSFLNQRLEVTTLGGADVNLNLNITFNFTDFEYEINGASFNPPSVPVLLQILSGAQNAQDLLPPGSVYTLPPNKVIEISIPGGSPAAPHPFHLHGHAFWVVRSAGNSSYNYDNPAIRDVVSTGPSTSDNVTIRFVTDNAGPWFLHCHIDWHLDIGLAIVFAEDTGSVAQEPTPDAWKNLCPLYDPLHRGPL